MTTREVEALHILEKSFNFLNSLKLLEQETRCNSKMKCVLNVKLNIISHYGNLNVILYVICLHSTAYECKRVEKAHRVIQIHTHTYTEIKSPYATLILLLIHPLAFVIKENRGRRRKETEITCK